MAEDPQQGGFAPLPPVGGPSLEEEERAMKSGRGRMLVAGAAAVIAAIAALGWFMSSSGQSEYGQVGQQVNGMRSQYFDAFWSCALPREDVRDVDTADELKAAIARFSANAGYSRIIRTDCLVHLDEHRAPLNALIAPPELSAPIAELSTALAAMRTAWDEYLAYLDRPDATFDAADPEADRLLTAVVRGWFDYRVAFGHVNDAVREHLPE
jgi:hypothetical protein